MAEVKTYHDTEGQSLTVWFGDRAPAKSAFAGSQVGGGGHPDRLLPVGGRDDRPTDLTLPCVIGLCGCPGFGDPQSEHVCEETGDEVVLMKDKAGHVIGFEKLNFTPPRSAPVRVAFESGAAR